MKKDIHPKNYREVTLVLPDGTEFTTSSAMGPSRYFLETDFRTHRAWVGGTGTVNTSADAVAKFNKKFAAVSSFSSKKKDSNT
jgi:large subunit ribosomal protein L31